MEYPTPFINHYDLAQYITTLKYLKKLQVDYILSAHSGIVDRDLIDKNLDYIEKHLKDGLQNIEEIEKYNYNIKNILLLKYEDIIRQKSGKNFDYKSFKRELWKSLNVNYSDLVCEHIHIQNIDYKVLKEALHNYVEKMMDIDK